MPNKVNAFNLSYAMHATQLYQASAPKKEKLFFKKRRKKILQNNVGLSWYLPPLLSTCSFLKVKCCEKNFHLDLPFSIDMCCDL